MKVVLPANRHRAQMTLTAMGTLHGATRQQTAFEYAWYTLSMLWLSGDLTQRYCGGHALDAVKTNAL